MSESQRGIVFQDMINKAGRRILVIDQATDPEQTNYFFEYINEHGVWGLNPYSAFGDANHENDNVPFIHGFNSRSIESSPFWKKQLYPYIERFFGAGYRPYDSSVNNGRFGDNPTDHRDTYQKTSGAITLLLYLNPVWNMNHAGETVFFSDEHEIELALLPKFCRLVIFDGYINHAARPPSRLFLGTRYTLAIKAIPFNPHAVKQSEAEAGDESAREARFAFLHRALFG
jgi:hypothetical protein